MTQTHLDAISAAVLLVSTTAAIYFAREAVRARRAARAHSKTQVAPRG